MSVLGGIAQRAGGYLAFGAVAACLLFYGFAQLDGILGAKDAATTASSIAMVARHTPLVRFRAALKAVQDRQAAATAGFAAASGKLRDSIAALLADTLDSSGERKPVDLVKVGALVTALGDTDRATYRSCSLTLLTCGQRAANAEREADSLSSQLELQAKIRPHRCGVAVGIGALLGWIVPARGSSGLGIGAGLTASVSCQVLRIPFF